MDRSLLSGSALGTKGGCDDDDHCDEGLVRFPGAFGGVRDDYRRRLRWLRSDFTDAMHRKTISSALFMFFATFASTVALGVVIKRNTKCSDDTSFADCSDGESFLGVTEWLLVNSIAGMVHALLGCQPLLVLRPTGPITAFVSLLFNVSKSLSLPFMPFLAWCGIFVGLYMTLIAALELSRHIKLLTRFLHDIFAFFVCSIYVVDGVMGVAGRFSDVQSALPAAQDKSMAEALFAAVLTAVLLVVAFTLNRMDRSMLLSRQINQYLVDYALTIATIVTIICSYLSSDIEVERIQLPDVSGVAMEPTLLQPDGKRRAWHTTMSGASGSVVLGAAVSAVPIVIFFFFDQNVSSLLCQKKEMNLRKGSYFHSSFLWMGVFNMIFPSFGCPFVTGSLPHSPQLVRALEEDRAPNDRGGPRFHVWENRVAPFFMYFLIGAALWFPFGRAAIEAIPDAAVDGILVFVGVAGLFETQLWARIWLLCTQQRFFPAAMFAQADKSTIIRFTIIQIAALGFAWLLNGLAMGNAKLSPLGLCFPLVIMFLVPFRLVVLPKYFSEHDLSLLDNDVDDRLAASELEPPAAILDGE